jgi:tagatose-6-phosphate ketose/aldose isomerase
MNSLASLLALPIDERQTLGLAYTPQEIAQQPETWLATYQLFRERHPQLRQFLQLAGIGWDAVRRPTVFLVGAGSSDYVGRSLAQLLRRSWQCEVLAVPSTDLLTHAGQWLIPGRPYLWISFSRSGESPEGVAVVDHALKSQPHVQHLIVTCNAHSRMFQMADGHRNVFGIALPPEVHDRGLAMTSSFSSMVVAGHCLAHIDDLDSYGNIVHKLAECGANFLDPAASLAAELAKNSFTKACFVGSGPLKAVATEAALKLLELTAGRVQTMSESALGLRHGPMASLDHNTLFVAFLSANEKVLNYEMDLLAEIGRKSLVQTRVAVIAGSHHPQLNNLAEHVFVHPSPIEDDYRPPLDVMLGQLLGLFFSLRCGLKPDCPSPNGAISRVVQNVLIHS